jgi:23S rRNA (adenine2503-C2)-methyltransferase
MTEITLLEEELPAPTLSLLDMSLPEFEIWLGERGQPAFRARQIWEWTYRRFARRFEDMTDLPRDLRERLASEATIDPLNVATQVVSKAGDTLKVLFTLHDGQTIEAVLMLYDNRRTLCISSQAGCAMGCSFCATAQGGLARNLSAGEIVAQVLYFARYLAHSELPPLTTVDRPTHVSNIVLMGMGEPLHNYNNVWAALRRLTDPAAFGLGARHITLSTVGLAPMIDRMADEDLQIGLAVSLHAPNDEIRTPLVPVNRAYPVDEVLAAVRRYAQKTRRRVTFEYALMRGINDTPQLASQLARKISGLLCHVNLIPLNPIPDSPFQPSTSVDAEAFATILLDAGIPTSIRLRRGIEINAGCGQLRRSLNVVSAPETGSTDHSA